MSSRLLPSERKVTRQYLANRCDAQGERSGHIGLLTSHTHPLHECIPKLTFFVLDIDTKLVYLQIAPGGNQEVSVYK